MIAFAQLCRSEQPACLWHEGFLNMLPGICRHARIAFANLRPEARADAVQEAIANALVAYVRLVQLNKTDVAYPSVLARFAVAQVREGRRVGSAQSVRDVLSGYAQRKKRFHVSRLDRFDELENAWEEVLVEDQRATPAEIAAVRIDFAAWLDSLSRRMRRLAHVLASGESTGAAARQFGVSATRISQLRKELQQKWRAFQGESLPGAAASA